ncbi:hypothetical protein JBL43_05340 [Aureibaculum sp. A20]|uniref:DUF695 domain-containing protein n=1 Tax=Aureibaculum flavum TaxID=2795986 RepID=A0ABS0WNV2_9FLAO|nr:hypothetical protein [Aureibaculum flavum]MBJ2173651.1 hypothetical protein [Aureibaculum flavum]
MNCKLLIEDEIWHVQLSDTNQVSFGYSIPYKKSIKALNPLWHDWDYTTYVPEVSYDMKGVTSEISPFVLKKELLNAVVSLIKKSKVTFFYFTPTSKQRGKIYANLTKLLMSKLTGKWEAQIVDEEWFYFTKLQIENE